MSTATFDVLGDIWEERARQEELLQAGVIPWDCTDPDINPNLKLTVLAEEFGEVARAILEEGPEELRKELVQLAAVATAWAESL